ncbi:MAG: PLDc N-terminal domain-containing protein [Desulfovibrionaceae bacterium]|nr:PLDc N-terminal domain-containing protein [Desulfovibrionaceae bacterium]MBR5734876.1 PLDc N-terminal domain-containing protein [Desulfovibrionaceae bacterium]
MIFSLTWWQLLLLGLPALINLWGIWHAMTHWFPSSGERIAWLLGCVCLPVIGGLAYLLFGLRRAGDRL